MKVILRIQKGFTTKTVNLPENLVRTEFRMPVHREMKIQVMREVQDMITPETTQNKCLIFRWNGKDTWGNSNYPIMDLVDIY